MASRQLLVVTACLASLLGLASWMERPSGRLLETPPVVEAAAAATEGASAAPGASRAEDQCTIVFIDNRKGCVFDGRAHLREAGADAAIPNPMPTPPASGAVEGGGVGWAAAALAGQSSMPPKPPSGQPCGPPQTTLWRERVEMTASEALDLQPLFDARPVGYGGADVAASFRAPPLDGDGAKPHTLWLLGDTFLGRVDTDKGQRLPGYFVHNSVATVPVWRDPGREADPGQVAFWHNVSAAGCPASLFRHPSELRAGAENECHEGGEYLWPVAGVAVDLSGDPQVRACVPCRPFFFFLRCGACLAWPFLFGSSQSALTTYCISPFTAPMSRRTLRCRPSWCCWRRAGSTSRGSRRTWT